MHVAMVACSLILLVSATAVHGSIAAAVEAFDADGEAGASGAPSTAAPFKPSSDSDDIHTGWASKVHATIVPGAAEKGAGI